MQNRQIQLIPRSAEQRNPIRYIQTRRQRLRRRTPCAPADASWSLKVSLISMAPASIPSTKKAASPSTTHQKGRAATSRHWCGMVHLELAIGMEAKALRTRRTSLAPCRVTARAGATEIIKSASGADLHLRRCMAMRSHRTTFTSYLHF